jgi:kynurenine formamidase
MHQLRHILQKALCCCVAALLLSPAAQAGDYGYKKSADFGPEDTLGAVNYLTDQGVIVASKLVSTGKTYALGMISSKQVPVWGEREYDIEVAGMTLPDADKVTAHDDRLITHMGIGTQIDGFGHVGIDGNFYNGLQAVDFAASDGLTRLGTEHIPPIVTRGVLLDVARHLGKARLDPSEVIGVETIQQTAKSQGVIINKGDVVLLHTGWMSMMEVDGEKYIHHQPGIDLEAASFLAESGVVAIGSDTGGLEVHPSLVKSHPAPVHGLLLANYGTYILENIVTAELAADQAYEFMFVLGQPRFAGSVQAIINPIAIR